MTIEIVDFPIKHGGSFHSYVKLPEGIWEYNAKIMGIHGHILRYHLVPSYGKTSLISMVKMVHWFVNFEAIMV